MTSEFFLRHFWLIVGSLGGLSAAAAVAATVLLGIPAAEVVARLLALVKSLFGFFSTPAGQAVAIVALCGGCLIAGILHGERKELAEADKRIALLNAGWKAREEKAAKDFAEERKKRDAGVDKDIEQLVADRTAELAAQAAELQKKVDAYEKANPHANCVLGPADIGRLRAPKR